MNALSSFSSDRRGYQRSLHVVALTLACMILPLIFVGAGVTSKEAGMAFPDWPTSDAHLVNPPGWLTDDAKLWEHGHRLVGWIVGACSIVLAVAFWRGGAARRWLGITTLLAIIVQGVMGGLRVTEISTGLAVIHGVWGHVCFCLACAAAMITSRAWLGSSAALKGKGVTFFRRGVVVGIACIVFQLISGAVFRHFGINGAFLLHGLGAIITILVLCWVAMWVLEQYGHHRLFFQLGRTLALLVGLQMLLGGASFLVTVMGGQWPAVVQWLLPSLHVLAGAMLLANMVLLSMCTYHILSPAAVPHTGSLRGAAMASMS